MTIIIGFEGISCVGKTSLIEHIASVHTIPYVPEINVVPKGVIYPYQVQDWFFKTTLYNIQNNAKDHKDQRLLLLDRTFFSSLAYSMTLDVMNHTDFLPSLLERYGKDIDDPANYPDFVFIFDEKKHIVMDRIKKKFSDHNEWSDPEFVQKFKSNLLKMVEESGKKYVISNTTGFDARSLEDISKDQYLRRNFSKFIGNYYRSNRSTS